MSTKSAPEYPPFEDPEFYLSDAKSVFARLQREEPVFYYEPLDIFILTKLDDIRAAAGQGEVFSSGQGLFLNDLRMMKDSAAGESVFEGFFPADAEHFAFADPPRHKALRSLITPAFAAKNLNSMRPEIDSYIAELLSRIEPGRPIDFVAEVADHLPIMISQRLLGIEGLDVATVKLWSDALESMNSADTREEIEQAKRTFAGMNSVFEQEFRTKRGKPGTGLVSDMLNASLDDEPVSEANILTYCTTVLAAGSDTTRALLTGTMLAFAEFPEQLDRLRNDRTLLNTAVEESLRWVTPARSFVRTATVDTSIRSTEIKAGQRVFLLYAAGNFDEEAFADPYVFDVGRKNAQQHVAFGFGPHSCIAAQLVRMQMRSFLTQFLDRFSAVQVVREPTPVVHVLRHSWYDAELIFDAYPSTA